MNLTDKSILVTGAGSGIGRSLAVALARRGARLTLTGRRRQALDETASLIEQAGGAAQVVEGDITDEAVRERSVRAAVERFGGLDVLVNNAGNVRAGRLEHVDTDDIRAQLEVNLVAPIMLTREALPVLRQAGGAAVVNVSSTIALVGMPFYATYAASKAGIAHFGEALRRELHGEGVRVVNVFPGATETPMMESTQAGPELGFRYETPDEVARAVVEALEGDAIEVIRGGESTSATVSMNRAQPRQLDAQIAQMKAPLEQAVKNHRSI